MSQIHEFFEDYISLFGIFKCELNYSYCNCVSETRVFETHTFLDLIKNSQFELFPLAHVKSKRNGIRLSFFRIYFNIMKILDLENVWNCVLRSYCIFFSSQKVFLVSFRRLRLKQCFYLGKKHIVGNRTSLFNCCCVLVTTYAPHLYS